MPHTARRARALCPPGALYDVESLQMRTYRGAHGRVCLAHVGFKVLALAVYLFGTIIAGFVEVFVVTTVLLAADFYCTKNISGRIMIGLRWWAGGAVGQFRYESAEQYWIINPVDKAVFWGALLASCAAWIFLCFIALVRLSVTWLPLALAAVSMTAANVVNYARCNDDIKGTAWRAVRSGMRQSAVSAPGLLLQAGCTVGPLAVQYGRRAAEEALRAARGSVQATLSLGERAGPSMWQRVRSLARRGEPAAAAAPTPPQGAEGTGISVCLA
eukprot:TRINITY_DN26004_c2_g1_i1.p1 TRINITY_DN26004_c2_g1~~TRINITY_DN26004_c2_g1_i1.p1  ORF type:complete len:272 (+),score=101.38 TRINITY_DN26004_c2_g1_i1:95-910(+)